MFIVFVNTLSFFSQSKVTAIQGKFEINVSVQYAQPMYEAYGNNITIDVPNEIILIDGKRLVDSDNFGTTFGFGIQVYGGMRLFKTDFIKPIMNIGYTQLESKYSHQDGFGYGVRLNIFSVGLGLQINPAGMHRFYPSLLGMVRFNEMGGETYHWTGFDYLMAAPRFGFVTGLSLNYKFNQHVGISFSYFYNYDNWLNKQTNEGGINNKEYGRVIKFRDEASSTNGLSHNRRVIYYGLHLGVNVYL